MNKTVTFQLAEPFESAREHMLGDWVDSLRKVHAWPEGGGEGGINYRTFYRAWWVYLICVIFFPIGLLALLIGKKQDFLQVELSEGGGTTDVEVTGTARPKVWRIVESWNPVS